MFNSTRIKLDNEGKYVIIIELGTVAITRNGQPWLNSKSREGLPGSKAWIAAAYKIEALENKIAELEAALRIPSARIDETNTSSNK